MYNTIKQPKTTASSWNSLNGKEWPPNPQSENTVYISTFVSTII